MALHILAVEDLLTRDVCLFLEPEAWLELRAAHPQLQRKLQVTDIQGLFGWQLQGRLEAAPAYSLAEIFGSGDASAVEIVNIAHVACLAATVETVVQVVDEIIAHPRLVGFDFGPVRHAVGKLHGFALHDSQLWPKERTGRRSSLSKRLLREFAALTGLMAGFVSILRIFTPVALPPDIFIMTCEVLASLIHNSKDAKRSFVAIGGLPALLVFLRLHPKDAGVQAGGLATLLALSARSVSCIQLMVAHQAHEVVLLSLQSFPSDTKVLTRATGLLANMSNVPCVCPVLQRCGILKHVRDIQLSQLPAVKDEDASAPFLRDFVKYLLSNLEEAPIYNP